MKDFLSTLPPQKYARRRMKYRFMVSGQVIRNKVIYDLAVLAVHAET